MNSPDMYSNASANAIVGIGTPINPFTFDFIELNLASLNTPVHSMYADIISVIIFSDGFIWFASWYRKILGANPNDIASDKESMFFPNSESLSCLSFLATHPSVQSNIIANIKNSDANVKLLFIDCITAMKPDNRFNELTISGILKYSNILSLLVIILLFLLSFYLKLLDFFIKILASNSKYK